ncbi:UvrD-helicase domain-containing protein [Amycolatopsis sp. PS_44_ISF1]|uniref:UvrD-helicase domain-containing protein n=1 Tax=Amycolatopsis sp. PS_44_ISF1 TaxID=2974917 RepID=UPI0028DF5C28|nr:UvrD-helicase domain-containing protein [Amycolatopsis sp. PS_44_ISF1]MDT8910048.1 UvrD-helicase domain-containing protein [Amycolatopsis sp. PS_44_ISF1]
MTARLSIHHKADAEIYRLDRKEKARFYDFSHLFRQNPDHPSLDLKPLKGNGRIHRAKLNDSYRVLLAKLGVDAQGVANWLVIAVRHRKDVYEELTVAVNRITGEIEFADLSVVGDSTLRKAGITLTLVEPEPADAGSPPPDTTEEATAAPLLAGVSAVDLHELGVSEPLIDLALAVTGSDELDRLVAGAPTLSADVLYGLAAGMSVDDVRREITAEVAVELTDGYADDLPAALARTAVTTADDLIAAALEEGDFRAWKIFLHPTQAKAARRTYNGPARVSGGPGTGKTVVALHRVKHLVESLLPGTDKPILLTTFTKNLTADLAARLASLLEPGQLDRVEIVNIDQLSARVVTESGGSRKRRISDAAATDRLAALLAELDERRFHARFLFEEWDQVILGQALTSRKDYFEARRAGRGQALTRLDRAAAWKVIEQFTVRLDTDGVETWGQFADRAARLELDRATKVAARTGVPGPADAVADDSAGTRHLRHRYRHAVIDEAQDLRAAHWTMLRAMVAPGQNDLFIAGDTYQRIYQHQVALGALGVNIRGRSTRLTLSYRSTKQILATAIQIVAPAAAAYDNLDDGTDTIDGYRSVLGGPVPEIIRYPTWQDELAGLVTTVTTWRAEIASPNGTVAVCAADHDRVVQIVNALTSAGISCAELTKDGPKGDGDIHVGTMHRMKGLEYERVILVAVTNGIIPKRVGPAVDPISAARRDRRDRSLLFVAATRARDTLHITSHPPTSPYLPIP